MVGVPGKSKGCNTCRQRKIACGLQRPKCAQCIRSNRECLGYDRVLRFVPVQASYQKRKTVWMMKSVFKDAQKPSSYGTKAPPPSNSPSAGAPEAYSEVVSPVGWNANGDPFSDMQLIVRSNRQQLLGAFASVCFPKSMVAWKQRRMPWPALLCSIPMRSDGPLEKATLALSAAVAGRCHNDPELLHESLRFYTQGLRGLQHALKSRLVTDDETLATCLALSLYEVMEAPGESRWGFRNHTNGCLQLVKLRGIEAHQSSLGHRLFASFRAQGLLVALETLEPNFLSDPLWMTEPWKYEPKLPIDELFDCLAEAPSIFIRANSLGTLRPMQMFREAMDLYETCLRLDRKLQHIYRRLENDTNGPLYWSVLSKDTSPSDDPILGKVFPVAFEFIDAGSAICLMMYWAITVMAWSGMNDLYWVISTAKLDDTDGYCSDYPDCKNMRSCRCYTLHADAEGTLSLNPDHVEPLGLRTDYLTPARHVCQSVEFCLQNPTLGVFMISTPVSIVYETLKEKAKHNFAREISWMKETICFLQDNGLRIHKYPYQP